MTQEHNLDDPRLYQRIDSQEMFHRLREMPAQCQRAWDLAADFSLPPEYSGASNIIILGMGGSAIGGDLLAGLAAPEARTPIMVVRDYQLPAYAGADTLVIASSYSGNTEETLSAFGQALRKDCKKLAITTGGKLKKMAEEAGVPVFTFSYQAQPRAALPYSLLPLLRFLQRLGYLADKSGDVAEAAREMEKLSGEINETVPEERNPAKRLARKLRGRLPLVYGAGVLSEVARRWKTQFNENSKAWSFFEAFPELNHNAVVGYHFPPGLAGNILVVMLTAASLSPRIALRQRVTAEILDRSGAAHEAVAACGASRLSQVLSAVLFGDYVSCYLAMIYNTDPSPVAAIDYLKQRLS